MQTLPRPARLARDSLRAGYQASEHWSPHQCTEVTSEPSVSSVSRELARERVRIDVINVKPELTRSILLLAFAALCMVLAMYTGWSGSLDVRMCEIRPIVCLRTRWVGFHLLLCVHSFEWALIPHPAPEAL
jgi:hypothetical protein